MLVTSARKPIGVPTGPHFAILIFKKRTVHHEGDKRSQTNPGHGYDAHDEIVHELEYIAVPNRDELNAQLATLYNGNHDRKDIVVVDVRGQVQVVVGLQMHFLPPDN